jgi:hypothetical protein
MKIIERFATWCKERKFKGQYSSWRPKRTEQMKRLEVVWALATMKDGSKIWIWICDICGGNCGQCGMTSIVGNVGFSMQRIVTSSGMDRQSD